MAALTVYARTADPVFVAASGGGDTFINNGDTEVLVVNSNVAAITLTIECTAPCIFGFTDDQVVSCGGQELTRIGPFEAKRFNSALGVASLTYSSATNVTVAAQRLR